MSGLVARRVRIGRLPVTLGVVLLAMVGFGPLPLAGASSALAQAQPEPAQSGLESLTFVTSTGTHPFSVEVMRTPEQLERGLMFRRYMPPDRGMLFDFLVEQPVMMWMKNTYISLDMVFITRSGVVASVAKNAEPLSERIIPSGAPVYAVVELNAGTADRIGLKTGDRVSQAMFKP